MEYNFYDCDWCLAERRRKSMGQLPRDTAKVVANVPYGQRSLHLCHEHAVGMCSILARKIDPKRVAFTVVEFIGD